jgi:ribosomal protein L11 methyltransferase
VKYPALDVRAAATELLAAFVDDYSPTALEERSDCVRVFFSSDETRAAALSALLSHDYAARPVDVDDEDWGRRSQESLGPVTVGRIVVAPPWTASFESSSGFGARRHSSLDPSVSLVIIIQPSMGFGTGHHPTTRLCLKALQTIDLTGRSVLDVGTGSGVLALAADRLGAAAVVGIDPDADAIRSAIDNLALNPDSHHVEFRTVDLESAVVPDVDLAIANLTGALLVRQANRLLAAVRDGGWLILSGLLAGERDEVRQSFEASAAVLWEREEAGWIGLLMKKW